MNFANLAAQASALADTMVSLAHARKRCSPDEANGCGSGAKEKTQKYRDVPAKRRARIAGNRVSVTVRIQGEPSSTASMAERCLCETGWKITLGFRSR
jgi:hypothetical protein